MERDRKRERDRNKVEIDTHLFVKWNKQIKLVVLDNTWYTQNYHAKSIT